jgi:RNA polymerase sigma-70 factor (sigma-E family)
MDFKQYVTDRSYALRRTTYLMCGDWHEAEDLVQIAFLKLYRSWRRVERVENRDAYVRQVIVRTLIDERRRGWRRERPFAAFPEDVTTTATAAAAGPGLDPEDRDELLGAMARIPARQRATLVLRYWEDQSVEQTAYTLGCSEGTVTSQTARGLAALREALGGVTAPSRTTEEGHG